MSSGLKLRGLVVWMLAANTMNAFDVLLTVLLSTVLVINQINTQILVYYKFIMCLYMFRALCVHHQEVTIVLYSIWYRHTYRCDDTRWTYNKQEFVH